MAFYHVKMVFVVAPTLCALAQIRYFKSRDLTLSLMVIHDFLLRDLSYGTEYLHLKEMLLT